MTTARDPAGVVTSSGDVGLIEIRPATFPGERLIVLVRRGAQPTEFLDLRAEKAPSGGGEVVWSTRPTAGTTAWGSVVFEVNTKPIGNTGCWRLIAADAPSTDPGIVVDLSH